MRTAAKLSAYGLTLAVVFGAAWTLGTAVGPLNATPSDGGDPNGHAHEHPATQAATPPTPPAPTGELAGLSATANGYRLQTTRDVLAAGATEPFPFRITGPDGVTVTHFTVENDTRLRLVLIRHDTTGYQHLYPTMAADGTWSTPLTLPAAGSYRLYVDFTPEAGPHTTLGTTIEVSGQYQPQPHSPHRTDTVDGYHARLDGDLVPGAASPVTVTLTLNGMPVTDLQTLLDVSGELVTLGTTDLGYQRTYTTGTGPQLRFTVTAPTPGRYRLFLTIRHHGTIHTAQFTMDATT
jgi:hypothetical protein